MRWRLIRESGSAPAPTSEPLVLHIGGHNSLSANGETVGEQTFVDQFDALSGGAITVDLEENWGAETEVARAIATGEVDGGWPSARVFLDAGFPGLQASEAPMVITNYDAEKAMLTGAAADQLLSSLEGTGIRGLSLAAGPLKRPWAAGAPLVSLADWAGSTFDVHLSTEAAAVAALGGVPFDAEGDQVDFVNSGKLRGFETDAAQYRVYDLGETIGMVTGNVVLWPKVLVMAFSQATWDSLTDEQQGWVQAAADAATQASIEKDYDDSAIAAELCDTGVRVATASDAQLRELRSAVEPVIDGLLADPKTAESMQSILAIAAEHPEVDELEVPADCRI